MILSYFNTLADRLIPNNLIAFLARLGVGAIFFMSARTKVENWLSLKDSTFTLFAEEYKLPIIPSDIAAYLATYAEHIFSVLLVLGLFTRFSALALLGMTLVIQLFVYPSAWPTHLTWAVPLLLLVKAGPGAWSLDRLCRID